MISEKYFNKHKILKNSWRTENIFPCQNYFRCKSRILNSSHLNQLKLCLQNNILVIRKFYLLEKHTITSNLICNLSSSIFNLYNRKNFGLCGRTHTKYSEYALRIKSEEISSSSHIESATKRIVQTLNRIFRHNIN